MARQCASKSKIWDLPNIWHASLTNLKSSCMTDNSFIHYLLYAFKMNCNKFLTICEKSVPRWTDAKILQIHVIDLPSEVSCLHVVTDQRVLLINVCIYIVILYIRLTFKATWSLANTPIVVFITVIFSSIVFSCSVLCKFCVFFLFLFKGSSKCVFFHLAVLFRFYHVLFVCIMYFYLNK